MPNEVLVAIIGSVGTILAAFIGRSREAARAKRADKSRSPGARPVLIFFTVLSTGLAITALLFAYTATSKEPPQDLEAGKIYENKTRRAYFVTLFCNATRDPKDLEVRLGQTTDSLSMVASESGGDRMSVSVVIPPGWFYRVDVNEVPGLGCNFKKWSL
jgi:hypothetical protein